MTEHDRFRAARDLLLARRTDLAAAAAAFEWPTLERFNWAIDWFDAIAKGDKKLALHHVENSLRLSANQPEIIRLREELKGSGSAESANYERSMMRRMLQDTLKVGANVAPSTAPEKEQASAEGTTPAAEPAPAQANATDPSPASPQ